MAVPSASFPPIPPFTRYLFRLRLHHSARLHFRHEVMLHSLLNEALGKDSVPPSVIPFACESGRVDFAAEEEYRIGITIAELHAGRVKERIERALAAYAARGWQGDAIPMLRWFTVMSAEALPPPDLDAECASLAGNGRLAIQFVSPLCLEIPRTRPHRYFDAACFPADVFLRRLWGRFFFFEHGRHPSVAETEAECPSLPAVDIDSSKLLWIDVPRTQKPPLGGVVGRLELTNPGLEWLRLLAAAQYLHIGKGTGDGFGAFRILNGTHFWNDPFGPSRTLLERAAETARLEGAVDRVLASAKAAGTDGVSPEQFSAKRAEILPRLARSLADGSYAANTLLEINDSADTSRLRALAVPTIADRIVQRAALDVLAPAFETLLEDASLAHRKGFSGAGPARAVEAAWNDGYRRVLDAGIESFFDSVEWERLFTKFDALYPFEPLAALVRAWITAPVEFEGRSIVRTRGLPQGAVISPLLANLFLGERRFETSEAKSRQPEVVSLYADEIRQPLYVTDAAVLLRLHHDALRVEREGSPAQEIPLRALSLVIFMVRPRSTVPLIVELAARGVPSFFCRPDGMLESIHGPFEPDPDAWLAQARASADESLRLPFAREIVAAKLHNYAALLVRHRLHDADAAAAEIRGMERSIANKNAVESVRGVEGAAAAVYYRCVARSLRDDWRFEGRERRPPPDPFNSLLSYGYTLLHNHCATALYAARLMPRIGLYHREHGAWAVLASDLQEEFRFLVDRLVWAVIHRREISPDAFESHDGGCWLPPEKRRWFVESFASRLEEEATPEGWESAVTWRRAITVQANRLRGYLLGKMPYRAVRVHG